MTEPMWFDGSVVAADGVAVHPMSTAVKYGAAVFEGLRAYWSASQGRMNVFRLDDHCRRLRHSARILGFDTDRTADDYAEGVRALLAARGDTADLHLRVQVYVDAANGLIDAKGPVSACAAATPIERSSAPGKAVAVSSWRRLSDSSMPPRVKSVGNYENSRLALLQARADGYDDAILLTDAGRVAEGPGANVFLVRDGRLVTPSPASGILEGITRDTVIHLAGELGVPVDERAVDRTELYVADEVFLCGTAVEIAPVLSVDRLPVGTGEVGELTSALHGELLAGARGERPLPAGWLAPVLHEERVG